MTEIQIILLDTFKCFISFCKENNISYFTCGGTTLGAVRHGGFIPWDDDIDVYVPRKDYDSLLNIRSKLKGTGFSLMCYKDYPYFRPYARFYNEGYSIESTWDLMYTEGPFIDVIPLDEATDDLEATKKLEKRYIDSMKSYRRCLRHLSWYGIWGKLKKKKWEMSAREIKRKLFFPHSSKDKYLSKFMKVEDEIRKVHGKYFFCYFHTYPIEKELFHKSFFSFYKEFPFENIKVRVPGLYKEYLTQLYGDYMKLPPISKRKVHYKKDQKLIKRIK